MALSDEDKKEIRELVGLKDGQTIGDAIGDPIQQALNGYDKSQRKSREAQATALEGIQETLKELKEAKPAPGSGEGEGAGEGDGAGGTGGSGEITGAAKEAIERLEAANKKLAADFKRSEDARAQQAAEAEAAAKREADRNLREAIKTTATSTEIGMDPALIDMVVGHLHGDPLSRGQESRIRARESGSGYEMQFGEDKITNEPLWVPLAEGLKSWAGTDIGKRFMPAVPGGGSPRPGGAEQPAPGSGAAQIASWDDSTFAGKSPAEILAIADKAIQNQ